MSDMELLERANPAPTDPGWGHSEAGQALFASVLDRIDEEVVIESATPAPRHPWVYALAAFAITLLAALPLIVTGGEGFLGLPPPVFESADEFDSILDDNFVTDEELELAADATVQCVLDQGGQASWRYAPNGYSVDVTVDQVGQSSYPECEGRYLRRVQFVWAAQHEPLPAEGFYFYGAVVRCTEAITGRDFGVLGQDELGFMSSEGNRTINAALDAEPDVYYECFDRATDSTPAYYYFVLECVTELTGDDYPNPVDAGSGRLTAEHILTLDEARATHPSQFDRCMGQVAVD